MEKNNVSLGEGAGGLLKQSLLNHPAQERTPFMPQAQSRCSCVTLQYKETSLKSLKYYLLPLEK